MDPRKTAELQNDATVGELVEEVTREATAEELKDLNEAQEVAATQDEIAELMAAMGQGGLQQGKGRLRGPGLTRPVFKKTTARAKGKAARLARRTTRLTRK
ncbi:hypothetical protein SM033_00093 [Vibrio phage vB_VpaM_sm033]|nr:hypothetical protein SM033_00093 [Vibrio phage vB_VpaM_sm033]